MGHGQGIPGTHCYTRRCENRVETLRFAELSGYSINMEDGQQIKGTCCQIWDQNCKARLRKVCEKEKETFWRKETARQEQYCGVQGGGDEDKKLELIAEAGKQ